MTGDIAQYLAALDGAVIPGGCDTCNAEQHIRLVTGRVSLLTVHHDDWCPTWRAIQRKDGRRS